MPWYPFLSDDVKERMMDQLVQNFLRNATTIEKGFFLMIVGISFVFLVQVIFYAIVKIWPKGKEED